MSRGYMPRSKGDDWETPPYVFDWLWKEFGPFTLDPAGSPAAYASRIIRAYGGEVYTPEDNGLVKPWHGKVFLNPPHSQVDLWVKKAQWEAIEAPLVGPRVELVCCLLPARTDTKWFHGVVFPYASYIGFISGRIKFGNAKNSAPFPSMVVIFHRESSDKTYRIPKVGTFTLPDRDFRLSELVALENQSL